MGVLTFCSPRVFQNFVLVVLDQEKGWRLRTRKKWLLSLKLKAQRFISVIAPVSISVFVSVVIAEGKSPKAFNCDDDEAAGQKVLVIIYRTKARAGTLFGGRYATN